jgi:signal transduction histidine kinase
LGHRSPGEVLALVALILSAFALAVVLDDGDEPGSLREQFGMLVARTEQRVDTATAIALLPAVALAGLLVVVARGRAMSIQRANRLARELGNSRHQIELLKMTLRSRDEFLLAVVHELRTPLTHVIGYAELMSGVSRPRHPDELGEMNAAIQSASSTMLRLMDDLVEVTRLQTDGFTLRPRPVDLAQLVRNTVAGFEAGGEHHHLSVDVPEHWLMVLADPERLRQVLVNLLTNAMIYSTDGGEVRVRARQSGHLVRVEVEDQGIGIDPEEHGRIFERFYRASGGKTYREGGSGLGLSIVKDLVEAHGGEVGLSSRPGVGSTFWFTVPTATEVTVGQDARTSTRRAAPAT